MKQVSVRPDMESVQALNDIREYRTRLLAVGDAEEWKRTGQALPADQDIAFVSFHEIDANLLAERAPDIVLSPLLAKGFDCIDLAELLVSMHFGGQYRAVCSRLPNPELVVREIRQLCPGLDFDLMTAN